MTEQEQINRFFLNAVELYKDLDKRIEYLNEKGVMTMKLLKNLFNSVGLLTEAEYVGKRKNDNDNEDSWDDFGGV